MVGRLRRVSRVERRLLDSLRVRHGALKPRVSPLDDVDKEEETLVALFPWWWGWLFVCAHAHAYVALLDITALLPHPNPFDAPIRPPARRGTATPSSRLDARTGVHQRKGIGTARRTSLVRRDTWSPKSLTSPPTSQQAGRKAQTCRLFPSHTLLCLILSLFPIHPTTPQSPTYNVKNNGPIPQGRRGYLRQPVEMGGP